MVTLVIFVLSSSFSLAQSSHKMSTQVFYFGGTDCGYCMQPKNIENINTMRKILPAQYKDRHFKFVLVVMDEDLHQGFEYTKKYPNWDELSIGKWYDNELMLQHVNPTKIPGVPHIMIYRDSLVIGKGGVPTIGKRTLLLELLGAKAIGQWMQDGYLLP